MTAEIAILNRAAIALAADSAVTITVGNKTKVYDTAEKLFEYSRNQPIALMIYNNVEFVGVPLDVLIRKYRAEKDGLLYETIEEAANDFLEYLRAFDHEFIEEKRYLYLVVRERLEEINSDFSKEMRTLISRLMSGEKDVQSAPEEVLLALLQKAIALEKGRPLPGFLTRVTLARFKGRFSDVVERAFKDVFKSMVLDAALTAAILEYSFRIMKSRKGSNLLTGLVFGGFAKQDMFPTLRHHEMDGVYFNQLKVLSTSEIDIDRKKKRAEVVPFAQKEMVERFMYGLDTELQGSIQAFVNKAFDEILNASTRDGEEELKAAVKKKVNARFSKMMKELKESSRQDLLDIVYFMSKKELADIAYALVELTSHKRRFSTDEQTVGGPIDVAIITKSEGLVWIRRKHYFGPETNQGYYSRVFGLAKGGTNEIESSARAGEQEQ